MTRIHYQKNIIQFGHGQTTIFQPVWLLTTHVKKNENKNKIKQQKVLL